MELVENNLITEDKNQRSHAGLYAALAGAAVAGGAFLAYKYYFQPWNHNWGASREDIDREMAGDQFVSDPRYVTNRAIRIGALPAEIFPWLVQMGQGRGGAYTYDWIENALGMNMHSAERVVPELQFLNEGDFLPLGNEGEGLIVKHIEQDRSLVLAHTDGNWTWEFGLYPDDNGNTTLVSRNRISVTDTSVPFRLYLKLIDPGAFLMERKMLLGIKQRVEKAKPALAPPAEPAQMSAPLM